MLEQCKAYGDVASLAEDSCVGGLERIIAIPDFRFQISDFRIHNGAFRVRISDSRLQIPDSRFQIPDSSML